MRKKALYFAIVFFVFSLFLIPCNGLAEKKDDLEAKFYKKYYKVTSHMGTEKVKRIVFDLDIFIGGFKKSIWEINKIKSDFYDSLVKLYMNIPDLPPYCDKCRYLDLRLDKVVRDKDFETGLKLLEIVDTTKMIRVNVEILYSSFKITVCSLERPVSIYQNNIQYSEYGHINDKNFDNILRKVKKETLKYVKHHLERLKKYN